MSIRWPRLNPRVALLALPAFLALGWLQGTTLQLAVGQTPWPLAYLFTVGIVSGWAIQPLIQLIVLNAPDRTASLARFAVYHVIAFVLYLLVGVLIGALVQRLGARAFGISLAPGPVDPLWLLRTVGADVGTLAYVFFAALWSSLYSAEAKRRAALANVQLEARLTASRLAALGARLEPHFLFNALNTVSSVMYKDLARTDALLDSLDGLLEAAFSRSGATWSLREEHLHAARYADFVQARFGDRIYIEWTVPAAMDALDVPRFALQSLVENAVKHNETRRGALTIRIHAENGPEQARLVVVDDGRGFGEGNQSGRGRSLARLEETLHLLHGTRAGLKCGDEPGGGGRVELWVPWVPATGGRLPA